MPKKHPPQKPHISPPYLPQIDAQRHPQYFELIHLEERIKGGKWFHIPFVSKLYSIVVHSNLCCYCAILI